MSLHRTKNSATAVLRIAVLALCLLGFLTAPNNAIAQYPTDDDGPNEFIFQVLMLPDWRISDAIFAYESNGKYYLPMKALSDGFEFLTEVDPSAKFAQGFASKEENSFVLDGARSELIISGQRDALSEDAILVSDLVSTDDIYVQLEVLNKIWPVEMRVDLSNITIRVDAEEELSFMREKNRIDKRKKLETRARERARSTAYLPLRENPYLYLGQPVIDYQAIYEYDRSKGNILGSNIFTGIQQVGKSIADYSANFRLEDDGQINRPDNVRLRFTRIAQGDESIILPTVRNLQAGDVTIRQPDLISSTRNGRGISLSNDIRDQDREFDRITIEGIGPPGWEIELYNNEELIDFGEVPGDGQYFFEDVILNYGNNQIKILFYGPQGQIREDNRSYNAGGNMLSPGKFRYNLGVLDSERSLIRLDNSPLLTPEGYVKTAEFAYGLDNRLTLFGTYSEMPEATEDKRYASAGLAMDTPIGLIETEAYQELEGGKALSIDYITKILGVRANIRTALFNNFESEQAGFGTNKKASETQAQLNSTVRVADIPIGLRLNALHTEREAGVSTSNITFTESYSRGGLRLSHNNTVRLIDEQHQQTNGAVSVATRDGPWQLRGGVNYIAYPDAELSNLNGQIRYRRDDSFLSAYNFAYNLVTDEYSTGVQLGYDFTKFLGTFDMNYRSDLGWVFGVRATTSLHPYALDGGYEFSSLSKRNYAPIKARAYLDKNADGIFNDGDEPMEGIRVDIGGGRSKDSSNEKGYLLTNAPPNRRVNIEINKASLDDPYYVPADDGFSLYPGKGKLVEADFAVVETGAIEGTAYRVDSGKAAPGLTVNLTNDAGETVMSSVTGFDGYFTFEFVPPASYTVVPDESHGVVLMENRADLTPDNLFIYGYDLYVTIPGFSEPLEQVEVEDDDTQPVDDGFIDDDLGDVFVNAEEADDVLISPDELESLTAKPDLFLSDAIVDESNLTMPPEPQSIENIATAKKDLVLLTND